MNHLKLSIEFSTTSDCEDGDRSFDDLKFSGLDCLSMCQQNESLATKHRSVCSKKGYKIQSKISDTLQGQMFKAQAFDRNGKFQRFVAIKTSSKSLVDSRVCEMDGMNFCVQENILKETIILQHLTKIPSIGSYIVKYIDFFETEQDYYLVMEYVEGVTLKQHIKQSFKLINDGKLSLKEYRKSIKFIMWQLLVTTHTLHNVYFGCHLDLCLENIMISNGAFIADNDGSLRAGKGWSIKLIDFGVSELFDVYDNKSNIKAAFQCSKSELTMENEVILAPQVYDGGKYDARAADMWSVGMILFQCMTNHSLYVAEEMWDQPKNGYDAVIHDKLKKYLFRNGLKQYFDKNSCELLCDLLRYDEDKRISASSAMRSTWFKTYYETYKTRIGRQYQSMAKKLRILRDNGKMADFPFYSE